MELATYFVFAILTFGVECGKFYGGSMSFETEWKNGKCIAKVYLLTGWALGDGPCGPQCSEDDTGNSTTSNWNIIPRQKGDSSYYGVFFTDFDDSIHRTTAVPTERKDVVRLVSDKSNWEMESSVMTFTIGRALYEDIIFEGRNWEPFSNIITRANSKQIQTWTRSWHMQVKLNGRKRIVHGEAGKPNSSPLVLMKPYYELGTDKDYTIQIPVIDLDEDNWDCRKAQYQESGTSISEYQHMSDFNFCHTINKKECSVIIRSSKMKVNDTGIVALTVRNLLRKYTEFEDGLEVIRKAGEVLSATSVQFYYRITDSISQPFFLTPPTPVFNQLYIVYCGAEFTVDVYASTNHSQRNVKSIDFIRKGIKYVERTELRNANIHNYPKAVVVTAIWRPSSEDMGLHLLCANAKDSAGLESVNLQCFNIDIREFTTKNESYATKGLHFVNVPNEDEIICQIHAYCRFPVYVSASSSRSAIQINGSSDDVFDLKVFNGDSPVRVQLPTNPNALRAEIQFKVNVSGIKIICLQATDHKISVIQCIKAKVLGKDPCEEDPCGNYARCISDDDLNYFECVCFSGYQGKFCNVSTSHSKKQLECFNGGKLSKYGPFCECTNQYTGNECNHVRSDCFPDPCNATDEICRQQELTYECSKVYNQTAEKCSPACGASAICRNGKCYCSIGFENSTNCNKARGHSGNVVKARFISPTLSMGSEVACETNARDCVFPLYIESTNLPNVTASYQGSPDEIPYLKVSASIPIQAAIHGMKNVYRTDVNFNKGELSAPRLSYHYVCFFLYERNESTVLDYTCTNISYSPKALIDSFLNPMIRKKYDFINPTLPEDSVFSCVINEPCHFFVYTNAASPHDCSSKPVVSDVASDVGIFPAVTVNGICQTDIIYINVSHPHRSRLCLKSRMDGSPRCFWMRITNDNDECKRNSNICKNGGICQPHADGTPLCHCSGSSFSGRHCEIGPCQASRCNNRGECHTDALNDTCFCSPGYFGDKCQHADVALSNREVVIFKNYASIITTNCYINISCYIAFGIGAKPGTRPELDYVSQDKSIEVVSNQTHEDIKVPGNYITIAEIKGLQIGNHKLCIRNKYEMDARKQKCININVIQGRPRIVDKIVPYFEKFTLSNNSHIQCEKGKECFINVWASNDEFSRKCPEVQSDKGLKDGVYVFQRPLEPSPCKINVLLNTDRTDNYTMCLTPFTPKHSIAGGLGRKVCYHINITLSRCTADMDCDSIHLSCGHGTHSWRCVHNVCQCESHVQQSTTKEQGVILGPPSVFG